MEKNLKYSIKLTQNELIYTIGTLINCLKTCRTYIDGEKLENLLAKHIITLAKKEN